MLLIENLGQRQSVFIEAKVKTRKKGEWSLKKEIIKFDTRIRMKRVSSSNLFTQLYYKHRLAEGIIQKDIDYLVTNGLPFPDWSTKKRTRKLGKNNVVLDATKLMKDYLNAAFFIGIVPDRTENIEEFVKNELAAFTRRSDPNWHWSIRNWGWLSWRAIKEFCETNDLENTLGNFKHNEGQIY
jgi:hypothetical protein